ncbi:hypothetical protein NMY22_g11498 [Coprinellus aureogranulatus]|nr:hypothetical protein NMY22_g11498 [Coprinellus aureogranulatus]
MLHPPTHRHYTKSIYLSFLATLKCISYTNLDPDMECRAWTTLAELGFRLGLEEPGVEAQVETAITKAHPTLRPYKVHLTVLSARISQYQHKLKLSQNTLKRLLTSYIAPEDLPHLVYTAHLGHIASFTTPDGVPSAQSLKAIQDMNDVALSRGHHDITKLSAVLRLQALEQMGQWDAVPESLKETEVLLAYPENLAESTATFAHTPRPTHDTAFLVYTLTLGIVFYTYIGETPAVEARTKVLHELLDGGALDQFGYGVVEIPFPDSQPLYIQLTTPRILMILAFLITSVAKRDPVGRKPKRKVFAMEGLVVVEKELKKDPSLAPWASANDVEAHFSRLHKLKADLICELVGVAVMRSEFVEAERHLAELIAHSRNEGLFNQYAARITLLHAQLAHALGQTDRAVQCYQIAAHLSRPRTREGDSSTKMEVDGEDEATGRMGDEHAEGVEDPWIYASARAGELWVRIGHLRREVANQPPEDVDHEVVKALEEELRKDAKVVVGMCEGMGSTLGSVASVIKACMAEEFLEAKMHLRDALKLATQSGDNHLRALVLALIASQYLNTSTDHAEAMLATSEQLAAGLGAQPKAPKSLVQGTQGVSTPTPTQAKKNLDGVGNAALRLWIGERVAELKRRIGDEEAARKQEVMNQKLRVVVRRIEMRAGGGPQGLATPTK